MNHTELQAHILDTLNRPDLTDAVVEFIADGEARLNRDVRVRQLSNREDLTITGDGVDLPADFRQLDSWYLDGPMYFGEIRVIGADMLPGLKMQHGRIGVPVYAAIINRKAYFAPVPQESVESHLTYFRRIPPLSAGAPTNWFLDENRDIYRLAALAESAPYLKDDERLVVWETQLDRRLEDLHRSTEAEAFGGTMVRPIPRPIGG